MSDDSFPLDGLLPKTLIGADRMETRGAGIRVAILDTGVDPGAEGLRALPNGGPKIVDVIDASGGDDVDTATVRRAAGVCSACALFFSLRFDSRALCLALLRPFVCLFSFFFYLLLSQLLRSQNSNSYCWLRVKRATTFASLA